MPESALDPWEEISRLRAEVRRLETLSSRPNTGDRSKLLKRVRHLESEIQEARPWVAERKHDWIRSDDERRQQWLDRNPERGADA